MRSHLRWGSRRLRASEFVVSHPFARKKAKGWGTDLVRDQRARVNVGVGLVECGKLKTWAVAGAEG